MNTSLLITVGIEINVVSSTEGHPTLLFRNSSENYLTSLMMYDEVYVNDSFWSSYICEKIRTLLFNRVKFENKVYKTEKDVLEFIDRNYINYTPVEKMYNVLEFLHKRTSYDGQELDLSFIDVISIPELWRKYYFKNAEEFEFYLKNLKDQLLIDYQTARYQYLRLKITLDGLTRLIQKNAISSSRQCFVAMSFDPSLDTVYSNAIQPAIIDTGFIPFIIKDQHVESVKTINDAIIAGIKSSHFTIADFTMHRAGVYFEAGYALGRGQQVIYTCREDDLRNAHFDTRNFQHIVWSTEEELRAKLVDKINAIIKS